MSGFYITGCPFARGNHLFLSGNQKLIPGCPTGQPKVLLCFFTDFFVGQPKCLVGQPQFDTGCPTGQPLFWICLFDLKYFHQINCKCLLNRFSIHLSSIYSQSIHIIAYRRITKSSSRQDFEIDLRSIPSQSFWIYWAIDLRTITL